MDDLIERDWVLKRMVFEPDADTVRMAPAVDAVRVVRCKDCRHFTHSTFDPYGRGFCKKIAMMVQDDFFCGFAKMDGGADSADS